MVSYIVNAASKTMNLKKFFISILFVILIMAAFGLSVGSTVNHNDNDGWKALFNGNNLEGWTAKINHYEVGNNFGETFRVEDEMIKVRYDRYEGDFDDRFGHLYFDTPYSYFHLSMEYRFVGELQPGAPSYTLLNSGLMFHSQDPRTMLKDQNWPISVEMQFLAGTEEGVDRPTGNMCSPGTEIVFQGEVYPSHCLNSTSKTYYGDQWVMAELFVYGDSLVRHIINGEEVLKYGKPQIGGGVVEGFDPKIKIDGLVLKEGLIALQSEGQPIDFRNIKIKNLKP